MSSSRFSWKSFSDGPIILLLDGPVISGPFNEGLDERLLRFRSDWMADSKDSPKCPSSSCIKRLFTLCVVPYPEIMKRIFKNLKQYDLITYHYIT